MEEVSVMEMDRRGCMIQFLSGKKTEPRLRRYRNERDKTI